MGVEDEKLGYFCGSLKNQIFRGGSQKIQYRGGIA